MWSFDQVERDYDREEKDYQSDREGSATPSEGLTSPCVQHNGSYNTNTEDDAASLADSTEWWVWNHAEPWERDSPLCIQLLWSLPWYNIHTYTHTHTPSCSPGWHKCAKNQQMLSDYFPSSSFLVCVFSVRLCKRMLTPYAHCCESVVTWYSYWK